MPAIPEQDSEVAKIGGKNVFAFLSAMYGVYFNSAGREFEELREDIKNAINNPDCSVVYNLMDEDAVDLIKEAGRGKNVELRLIGLGIKHMMDDIGDYFPEATVPTIKAFGKFFRNGSEPAFRVMQKASGITVFDPWIRQNFRAKEVNTGTVESRLKALVLDIAGRPDSMELNRQETLNLRTEDKKKYKEYMTLKKQVEDSWKKVAENFIRESGRDTVPVKEVTDYLDEVELTGYKDAIVPGFTGNWNALLEMCATDGERLNVPYLNPATYVRILMNPRFKPGEYYCIGVQHNPDGGDKYIYRVKDRLEKKAKKFSRISALSQYIDSVRGTWLHGLANFKHADPYSSVAVLLELAYQFSPRTGTEGTETAGESTFGLSTLRVKHVTLVRGKSVVFKYPGKDGILHANRLVGNDDSSRKVINALEKMLRGKGPEDRVFTYQEYDGEEKPIQPRFINNVLTKLANANFSLAGASNHRVTFKDFRTMKGTNLFVTLADKALEGKEIKSVEELNHIINEVATDVGVELKHVRFSGDGEPEPTPKTALASYIDPSAQAELYERYNLPKPAFLLRLTDDHRLENVRSNLLVLSGTPVEDEPENEPDEKPEEKPEKETEEKPSTEDVKTDDGEKITLLTPDPDAGLLQDVLNSGDFPE